MLQSLSGYIKPTGMFSYYLVETGLASVVGSGRGSRVIYRENIFHHEIHSQCISKGKLVIEAETSA